MKKSRRIKVSAFRPIATRLSKRAAETTGGTWTLVGYIDGHISAGEKIRRGLPHERVDILPGDTVEDIEILLATTAAKLRNVIADAIAKHGVPSLKVDKRNHHWAKAGAVKSRR